jgi:hypothetical protein
MAAAILAWNMMGGVVDFSALPIVSAVLGVDDVELLVRELCLIRDFKLETRG